MRTPITLILVVILAGCGGRSVGLADLGLADLAAVDSSTAVDTETPPPPSDPSCQNVSCGVLDTCCECRAYDKASPPTPIDCAALCDAPLCESQGINAPFGYCLRGRCLLGADSACTSDSDCGLVNDCCGCMALPAALAQLLTSQCAADCFVAACDGMGLSGARARCVQGRCRLGF
jgi:hypothetical protein